VSTRDRGTEQEQTRRRRVPAAERRQELIRAAVTEFAKGGLHGTAVSQIAQRVGVAQPYVFSLFPTKRELFIAASESGFRRVEEAFTQAAEAFERGEAPAECEDVLDALGHAYTELLASNRDYLMLQHQSYAACDDELVRAHVRRSYAELVEHARRLSDASADDLDDFIRHGMALNVAAALGVADLSIGCDWVLAALTARQLDEA
jgi:AcrR family transcriptional regulator